MTGYVFHCTPCGKPHAGECPTKLVLRNGRDVVLGRRWVQEYELAGKWIRIDDPVWTVVRVDEKFVDIDAAGVNFKAAREAFSHEGWQPPMGRKWRMVPA